MPFVLNEQNILKANIDLITTKVMYEIGIESVSY